MKNPFLLHPRLKRQCLLMLLTVIATLCHTAMADAQVSFGHATPFDGDWRFALVGTDIRPTEGTPIAAEKPNYDDTRWRRLQLPHDWSVEHPMSPQLFSCTGYLPGGVGGCLVITQG